MQPAVFLPGILMPASLRYAPLLDALGYPDDGVVKELEIYAGDAPPSDYSIQTEIDGLTRFADERRFERFHLYGHSGGGACAIAYAASHPERVHSLGLDEPATDFSPDAHAHMMSVIAATQDLPPAESLRAFLRLQLAEGVDPPPPPPGSPPPWMASRPAGIAAFMMAAVRFHVPSPMLARFRGPVSFSYGTRSHPSWLSMRDRLAAVFDDFAAAAYPGLHHLNTSHIAEPERVATALRTLWSRAEERDV